MGDRFETVTISDARGPEGRYVEWETTECFLLHVRLTARDELLGAVCPSRSCIVLKHFACVGIPVLVADVEVVYCHFGTA